MLHPCGLSVGGFERAEDQISLSHASWPNTMAFPNMQWVVFRENQTIFCIRKGILKQATSTL